MHADKNETERKHEMTTKTQQENKTTWSECQCEDCTGHEDARDDTQAEWWTWPIPVAGCAEKVCRDA